MVFATDKQPSNIFYKTNEEIELIRESCLLVCKALTYVAANIRPGITGAELDKNAEQLIRDHGAVPGFKGYRDFPYTLCVSVDAAVVHGFPSKEPFRSGQVVSVDCGVFMNGYYGDAAFTFPVGDVPEDVMKLLRVTKTSLYLGIEAAVAGKRLGDVGYAIQTYAQREHKYSVVRELVGHGIGKNLHEDPEVPNYGRRGKGIILKSGLVIAVEPMINMGKRAVEPSDDGWTILTKDRKPSAHYEHTIAIRKGEKADILSDHTGVEAAIENNPNVKAVEAMELTV